MFGFKKSKGRRNARKRDDDPTDDSLEASDPVDIVKRSSRPASKPGTPLSAFSGLSFGTDDNKESQQIRKTKISNIRAQDTFSDLVAEQEAADIRKYTEEEIDSLKNASAKPTDIKNHVSEDVMYPFAEEKGIPNAQDIYLAKKLRRQRQAAISAETDSNTMDVDTGENDFSSNKDFISLSGKTSDTRDFDDPLGTTIIEGEDEMDAIIIDNRERAEFVKTVRQAKEETIEQAQDADEPSDWEAEQLRSAGIALDFKSPGSGRTRLPEDDGNFEFDDSLLRLMLEEENNQVKIEQFRLEKAREEVKDTQESLIELNKGIKEAEAQLDHFMALNKGMSESRFNSSYLEAV